MRFTHAAASILAAVVLVYGCDSASDDPAPSAPPPPPATPEPEAEPEPEPESAPGEGPTAVRVVSSDGDWNVLSIFDDAYRVTFPGTFEWVVRPHEGYTAYDATALYRGRIYTIRVHRHEPDSRALADPLHVDDACAAFGLTQGAIIQPREDLSVAGGLATGRMGRYTYESRGQTSYDFLVVFRVFDDIVFHSIMSRQDYAPVEHFRRMNEGFSLGDNAPEATEPNAQEAADPETQNSPTPESVRDDLRAQTPTATDDDRVGVPRSTTPGQRSVALSCNLIRILRLCYETAHTARETGFYVREAQCSGVLSEDPCPQAARVASCVLGDGSQVAHFYEGNRGMQAHCTDVFGGGWVTGSERIFPRNSR